MASDEPEDVPEPAPPAFTRRRLLLGTAVLGVGAVVGVRVLGSDDPAPTTAPPPSGPPDLSLKEDPAGVLDLPEGFEYRLVSSQGDALDGGGEVPGRFDGMGAFEAPDGGVALVRNHELGLGGSDRTRVEAPADMTYDPVVPGGVTIITLDARGEVVSQRVALAGTSTNCSGGVTPWGTWLTCEETELKVGNRDAREHHGWVFEVHPFDDDANRDPTPLTGLGRFAHEAVAIDPETGDCYLTEDDERPNGLLYRFEPTTRPGALHSLRDGGRLSAMHVEGVPDLSVVDEVGTELPVTWKEVPDPSALGELGSTRKQFSWVDRSNRSSPVTVTKDAGDITRSYKLEGAWWRDGLGWFTASYARPTSEDWSEAGHDGQVWSYDPARSILRLEAFFPISEDPDGETSALVDGPDNITGSPWGGVFVATDGEGEQHLVSVDPGGEHVVFARNAENDSELCGVALSPDESTLFFNVMTPGRTFAITGPFERLRTTR